MLAAGDCLRLEPGWEQLARDDKQKKEKGWRGPSQQMAAVGAAAEAGNLLVELRGNSLYKQGHPAEEGTH